MRDRRERNIEKGGREKERGRKRGRKHVEEVRSCFKSWKRLVDAITHTVRACHMALDGSFLLRSRPLFSFIPSSFREETRCFRGRIRVICLIYPVTRDWFNKIYDDIRRKKENFQFLSLKLFTYLLFQSIYPTSSIPFFYISYSFHSFLWNLWQTNRQEDDFPTYFRFVASHPPTKELCRLDRKRSVKLALSPVCPCAYANRPISGKPTRVNPF